MNKYILTLTTLMIITASFITSGCKNCTIQDTVINEAPVNNVSENKSAPKSTGQFEDFYTPAFQLIWNDFSNQIIKGKVDFTAGNTPLVDNLNKQYLTADMLDSKDYYKTMGPQIIKTKKRIEKELYRKFREKSKLLDNIEWYKNTAKNDSIVLYSMFKKDISFKKKYPVLNSAVFNNGENKVKYFGLLTSPQEFISQIKPVYYNSPDDNAVILLTKEGDEIILQRTDSNESVLKIWNDLYQNHIHKKKLMTFEDTDKLMVPFIKLEKRIEYKELCDKEIKGSKYEIKQALEDIEFSLDNTGAKLRNEAVMSIMKMSMPIKPSNNYFYNKPFVLFIRYQDAAKPYFALKIKDDSILVKDNKLSEKISQ